MSHQKIAEAHRLLSQGHALVADGHTILADTPAPSPAPAPDAPPTKKGKKSSEPTPPAVAATPESTAPVAPAPSTPAPSAPAAPAGPSKREAIRDTKIVPFAKQSKENTDKVKHLLAQYGVEKFGQLPDDKLATFETALDAIINPSNTLDV